MPQLLYILVQGEGSRVEYSTIIVSDSQPPPQMQSRIIQTGAKNKKQFELFEIGDSSNSSNRKTMTTTMNSRYNKVQYM